MIHLQIGPSLQLIAHYADEAEKIEAALKEFFDRIEESERKELYENLLTLLQGSSSSENTILFDSMGEEDQFTTRLIAECLQEYAHGFTWHVSVDFQKVYTIMMNILFASTLYESSHEEEDQIDREFFDGVMSAIHSVYEKKCIEWEIE